MHRTFLCGLIVALALSACASSTDHKPAGLPDAGAGTAAATPVVSYAPSGQMTEVFGTPPEDLTGTWLVIMSVKAGDGYTNSWHGLRVGRTGTQWWAEDLRRGAAPKELSAAWAAAEERHVMWEIDAATVEAARANRAALLAPQPEGKRPGKIVLRGREQVVVAGRAPAGARPAQFAIDLVTIRERGKRESAEAPPPGRPQRPSAAGWSYYAEQADRDHISGWVSIGSVAHTGLIDTMPIGFSGAFRMYRLE